MINRYLKKGDRFYLMNTEDYVEIRHEYKNIYKDEGDGEYFM